MVRADLNDASQLVNRLVTLADGTKDIAPKLKKQLKWVKIKLECAMDEGRKWWGKA